MVCPRFLSLGPSTLSRALVPACPFLSQSPPTLVRTDIYQREEFGAINSLALSGAPPSAAMPYSLRPVCSCLLSRAQSVKSPMSEICMTCLVLTPRAPGTVLDLVRMLLWWLREVSGQEPALQGCHVVAKPEVVEDNKIIVGDEEAAMYGDPPAVKRGRRE